MALAERTAEVHAKCSLEESGDRYTVSAIDFEVRGSVDGLDAEAFERAAREADAHCPISVALRDNVELRLSATLA